MEKDIDATIALTLGNEVIETTAEHPFYTQSGWKDAADLTLEDQIKTKSGNWQRIEATNFLYTKKKVYNFEVADWHTYFVGAWEWLVHNVDKCISKGVDLLRKHGKAYIKEIAKITGRRVHPKQLKKIKDALRKNKYSKLSKKETARQRRIFNNKKDDLIKKWEKETGQKWPTYDKDVLSKKGKPFLKKGDKYDAHHIIENTHGGPHKWWNIHPAKNPTQHQGGIHGKDGVLRKLLGG